MASADIYTVSPLMLPSKPQSWDTQWLSPPKSREPDCQGPFNQNYDHQSTTIRTQELPSNHLNAPNPTHSSPSKCFSTPSRPPFQRLGRRHPTRLIKHLSLRMASLYLNCRVLHPLLLLFLLLLPSQIPNSPLSLFHFTNFFFFFFEDYVSASSSQL